MKIFYFVFLLLSINTYCQNQTFSQANTWNISELFSIERNKRTTITLFNKDSSIVYCLFDNEIYKDISLRFLLSEKYLELKSNYNEDIILPLPPLKNELYFIKYTNDDTTFTRKFIYLK